MPHFFINSSSIKDNSSIIVSDKSNYQHIAKSLRAKVGEKFLFIDENKIQYEGKISKITNNEILVNIEKQYHSMRKLDFELYLAQAPLRSDSQNFIIEKATELGIMGTHPILTDNCAMGKNIIEKKIKKWQNIMVEASKQCERADIPTCFELSTLENLLNQNKFDKILTFTERSADFTLKDYFRANKIEKGEKLLVIIGPEGGFSNREFNFFKEQNLTTLTLGDLILKAETAVTVALGNIIYEYNNGQN